MYSRRVNNITPKRALLVRSRRASLYLVVPVPLTQPLCLLSTFQALPKCGKISFPPEGEGEEKGRARVVSFKGSPLSALQRRKKGYCRVASGLNFINIRQVLARCRKRKLQADNVTTSPPPPPTTTFSGLVAASGNFVRSASQGIFQFDDSRRPSVFTFRSWRFFCGFFLAAFFRAVCQTPSARCSLFRPGRSVTWYFPLTSRAINSCPHEGKKVIRRSRSLAADSEPRIRMIYN